MQEDQAKIELFETRPLPSAIATMAIPMVMSSLVMVLYSLADTYFVSLLNSSIQNAAVTLASPVLLAFNAVNNLFGVGASSMMSRAMGLRDYETVRRTSVFSFYCALASGLLFSLLCTVFHTPLLGLLGADIETAGATSEYMFWTVTCGAAPAILNVVMGQMVRAEGASVHASIGVMSGCLLNIVLDPIFILPWGLNMGAAGAG
ncbi:MAG: MATE family efflux transporter, partial [Ruminiclostridium sp.]|nr:MATE family efflux transporter [Ruminiclostridium sp.]